jgi:hypothetical protein
MADWTLSPWTDAGALALAVDRRARADEARGKRPREWFRHLCETAEPAHSVMFLAHALPRYECVVWAVRSLLETGAVERTDPGMVAALRWIDDPCEALRRAAEAHAETADEDAPSTALCQAVFLSGGSLAPEDLAAIQPPPDLCAKLAAAAILRAAFAGPEPRAMIDRCLALGDEILIAA